MSLLEKEQEERLVHEGIPEGDGYTALDSGMQEEVEKYILTPTLVKREDLVPNQANDKFGIYDIEELAESIRVFSLLQPLHVKKRSDGKYDIISGHRRFLAICMLQDQKQNCYMDGIPCVYSNVPTSKLDEMILVYEANIHSRKYGGEYLGYIRDLYNLYLEKQNEDENFRIESGNLANYLGMKLGFKNSRQSKKYINIFDRAEGWIYDAIEDKKRYRRYDASNSDADRENCRIAKNGELKKGMTIDDAVIITNLDNVDDQEKLHRLYDENGFITDEVLDRYRKKKGKTMPDTETEAGTGMEKPETSGKGHAGSLPRTGKTSAGVDLSAYRDDDYLDSPSGDMELVRQHASQTEEDYNGNLPEDDYEGYGPEAYSDPYSEEGYDFQDDGTGSGYEGFAVQEDQGFGSLGGLPESHQDMKESGTDVLLWISELSAKNEITPYDRVMVDSVLKAMSDFYFPLYEKEGYIKEDMIPVLQKIADIINPLLEKTESAGFSGIPQGF